MLVAELTLCRCSWVSIVPEHELTLRISQFYYEAVVAVVDRRARGLDLIHRFLQVLLILLSREVNTQVIFHVRVLLFLFFMLRLLRFRFRYIIEVLLDVALEVLWLLGFVVALPHSQVFFLHLLRHLLSI